MSVGIDLGARKIAIVDLDADFATAFEVRKSTRCEELHEIARLLRDFDQHEWLSDGPIWVESPIVAGARNLQTTIAIAQTSGVVHSVLADTHPVAVSSWKQRTVGKGNADKAAVRQWLDDTHPALAKRCNGNQDLYDATCIALYGRAVKQELATGRPTDL